MKTVITQIVTIEKNGNVVDLITEMPNGSQAEMVLVEGETAKNYCISRNMIFVLTSNGELRAFGSKGDKLYDGEVLLASSIRAPNSLLEVQSDTIVLTPNSKRPKEQILYPFWSLGETDEDGCAFNIPGIVVDLYSVTDPSPRIILAVEKNRNNN